MGMIALTHDAAWRMTQVVMPFFDFENNAELQQQIFSEIYVFLHSELERFERNRQREVQNLKPLLKVKDGE